MYAFYAGLALKKTTQNNLPKKVQKKKTLKKPTSFWVFLGIFEFYY